jgi:prevent-host-death family protein
VATVETVGLRELRQNASELVARAQQGHTMIVTVSGRAAAQLGPLPGRSWRRYEEVAGVLAGPGAPDLAAERDDLDHEVSDPFVDR